MTPAKTREQMIADALAIVPQDAYAHRNSPNALHTCATPLYTSYVSTSGVTVPLILDNARYGAGYVRVSSIGQKEDGWSVGDQIERIVDYFTSRGEAFRIFSDASLSGKLPLDDELLIEKMLTATAERYEEAFRAVYLSMDKYKDEHAHMEAWLTDHLRKIRSGSAATIPEDGGVRVYRGRKKKNHNYRPALTEFMRAVKAKHVHTLALSDISRLARNQALTLTLAEDLEHYKVKVVGLIETLEWISDKGNLGSKITNAVLTIIAEHKLREVCIGAIRGFSQMLAAGKPHAFLPHYMKRDKDGNAVLVSERAEVVRRVTRYILDNPNLGYGAVATYLNKHLELYPVPQSSGKIQARGLWGADTIKVLLTNPALIGYQEMFGRRWKVLPTVITEAQFDALQQLQKVRKGRGVSYIGIPSHLLTGLLKCRCGRGLIYVSSGDKRPDYYRCGFTLKVRGVTHEHDSFKAMHIEGFADELGREAPHLLLAPYRNTAERSALEAERLRLKADQDRLREERFAVRREATLDAELMLRDKYGDLTPDLAELAQRIAGSDTRAKSVEAAWNQLSESIEAVDFTLRVALSGSVLDRLEERLIAWHSLATEEKNELLRKLIAEIRFSDEGLILQPNAPRVAALPPIPIQLVPVYRRQDRALPSVEEWIKGWGARIE